MAESQSKRWVNLEGGEEKCYWLSGKMAEMDISAALQAEIAQARQQGQHQQESQPRATTAWFDPDTERLFIELRNGVIIGVPQGLLQGLAGVPPEVIADVEVSPSGYKLHWETVDVDLGVPQLVAGLYGTKTWMGELGRQGGKSRSATKAKAARANGKRGGRPRKNPKQLKQSFKAISKSIRCRSQTYASPLSQNWERGRG